MLAFGCTECLSSAGGRAVPILGLPIALSFVSELCRSSAAEAGGEHRLAKASSIFLRLPLWSCCRGAHEDANNAHGPWQRKGQGHYAADGQARQMNRQNVQQIKRMLPPQVCCRPFASPSIL